MQCVSRTSEPDGTVLLIDSVKHIAEPKGNGPDLIVYYRRVTAPGQHTTNRVWPYALLITRGLHKNVQCQPLAE